MATELIAGVKHLRDGIEAQAVLAADMSVIGIIGTAPDANADQFPLNIPVVLYTNDKAKRLALGATGTLVEALAGISAQLANGVGAARCVLVRVEESETASTVIGNMIGSEASSTGVWAFLGAPADLGVTPRLLIAPGYTSQTSNGLASLTLATKGSAMTEAPTVSFTGGGSDPNKVLPTAHAVMGTGADADKVASLVIDTAGSLLSSPLTVTFAGGGTEEDKTLPTATATVDQIANGVCAIMPTICERLKAMFLPEGPTSSRQAAVDWLETLPQSARILHPLRQDAKILDADGNLATKPLSPYIVALYARRDAEFDGRPGHSIANQQIYGIVGVSPSIPFSITDPAVVGQDDLAISLGIVFRGDTGVDGALSDGGFTFWGTDTLSEQSEWLFANVCRMRDYIELMQVRAVRTYLGKFNLTSQTVQAIINTLDTQLRTFKADGDILDYRIEFDPDANQPSELRLGNIDLTFKAEEPPVLRKITIRSRRYAEALDGLVRSISVQLGNQAVA
jgi:phage tail sheath protein FI